MYCPSCGNETTVEVKYCKRCGVNLSLPVHSWSQPAHPVKLTGPTIVLGVTMLGAMGILFAAVTELARIGIHPAAVAWIVIFSMAILFGFTALLIRFWSKLVFQQRESKDIPTYHTPAALERGVAPQLPARDPVPSVTENTTRTFSPIYPESTGRGSS